MLTPLAIGTGLLLAFANGSNDNFKGVATLYGSGTATYRGALGWATVAQLLGSAAALMLAHGLLATFSGKGLVPAEVMSMKSFALAAGMGAGATVMIATRIGLPISTTHALTGALFGAGFLASDSGVNFSKLGTAFFLPLLLSPVIALAAGAASYRALRGLASASGLKRETCVCVGTQVLGVVPSGLTPEQAIARFQADVAPGVTLGARPSCMERYSGKVLGFSVGAILDHLHYASGAIVCFARALNDTPKIAATLLIGMAFSPAMAMVAVAGGMAVGGLIYSRRIAETMAHKVTAMDPEQGFSANLVTGALVISASAFGLPVSTTHVSVGSILGVGVISRRARWKIALQILLAWVTTLPMAAILGAGLFLALRQSV